MPVDIKTLYKVVGEDTSALKKVEEAIAWLLSPKAEGIGEKLLRDAHDLHGKPITIVATATKETGYTNLLEEHTVQINPKHIAGVTLKAEDGTEHIFSIERVIAHELTHAGQREATKEIENKLTEITTRAETNAMSHFSETEIAEQQSHLNKALESEDYHTARKHVVDYVDKTLLPIQTKAMQYLHNDPEFIKYMERLEVPAVVMENKIATLRGEPLRYNYATSHDVKPETLREMMIDQLSEVLEIHTKPKIAEDTQLWVTKVTSGTNGMPTKSHPRIANHKDGGKTSSK